MIVFYQLFSCSTSSIDDVIDSTEVVGTGLIKFTETESTSSKIINIYYHVPLNSNNDSKIVFVFHGGGRNAKDYRNAILADANKYNFIAIVPEFSNANFSGGDGYNLGNVFKDGDNPTAATLNSENEWAFSLITPIFNFMKEKLKNTTEKYHLIGHSAGAQFAHRLIYFKPNEPYDKVVVSASGWYTVPDFIIDFPYGFQKSPLMNIDLNNLFASTVFIQVGELDNNPNDGSLRRNEFADKQGFHRFSRAYHFFEESKKLANSKNIPFNWQIETNLGLDHNYIPALNRATDLLFK